MTGQSMPPAGRTHITDRALRRVIAAVTGDELLVEPSAVSVALAADQRGALALDIASPIRLVPLARAAREPAAVSRMGGTALERAGNASQRILSRVHEITGRTVGVVDLRLTGANQAREARVQ